MRAFAALLLLVFLLTASSANAREGFFIRTLSIRGNGDVSEKEIRNVISEIIPPPPLFFWKPHPKFDISVVERNMDNLRQFLVGNGYYSSSVVWQRKSPNQQSAVDLTVDIELGRPITVSAVSFEIDGDFPPLRLEAVRRALAEVPMKRGGRFSARRFKTAKGVVKNTLLEMGYVASEVDSKAEVYRSKGRAFITFKIKPGRIHKFGDIDVRLSDRGLRNIVIDNITYKTGEPASPSKLLDSKRRIKGLGYFDSVSITSQINPESASVSTVVEPVRRKTMTFEFGAGAGRVDKVRGRIKLTNRNFFNLNRTLEISARASFASQGAAAVVQQPGFFGHNSLLAGLFEIRRDDFPSYEADFLIFSTELKKDLADGMFSFRLSPTVIDSNLNARSGNTSRIRGLRDILLVLLRGGFYFTKTDNPVDPSRGLAAGFDTEFSTETLGSDRDYVKAVFETSGYYGFGGVVVAKKIQAGFIETFGGTKRNGVPLFARLFAGGSKSMRGFSFQKLGPLDGDKDPLGGNSLIIGSIEVRFPIQPPKLGGVVFLDYGNVFAESFDYNLDDLRYAVGAGLRYKVSGIPVAFDFGYVLNPNPRLRRWQIFVDVGQAF